MKESIFKKNEKKSFAFVEDQNTQNNVNELDEFVNSGRGQTKKVLNPKGRPKVLRRMHLATQMHKHLAS